MKNYMKNKLTNLIFILSVFCGFFMVERPALPAYAYASGQTALAVTQSDSQSIAERLSSLDGVKIVQEFNTNLGYERVYELAFTQPVSYDDPSAGTFEQHAWFFYSGDENVTIVNTDGYSLVGPTSALRLKSRYNASNANIIDIEYRFYGDSVPEDLNEDSVDYWKYLNSENAAMDFHHIVQKLSAILTGKRLWTGSSKGGFATIYQCYFQEKHGFHDADAFLSWVAPLCSSQADDRMIDALYTTIGDDIYGKETAKKYRDLVLRIQLEFIRYRDKLQQRFYDAAIGQGCKFRKIYFTSDPETAAARLWDVSVSDFAIAEWQYLLDWDQLAEILNIGNEEQKIESLYELMANTVGLDSMSYNDGSFPCYIQSMTEEGNYRINLSYVRKAIEKEQEKDPSFPDIVLPEALEIGFSEIYFTEEQKAEFRYSCDVHDALLNWAENTTSNVIMIQGALDPWNFVGFPVTDNAYIHRYVGKNNHEVGMSDLTEAEQTEIWTLLNKWLSPDPEPQPQTNPESDGSVVNTPGECFTAKGTTKSKTKQTITWTKVSGAQSYKVYRARCGKTGFKCIATVTGTKANSKVKAGKNYKYYVEAYAGPKGTGKKISKTVILHLAPKGTKYTNVKKVSVSVAKTSLAVGDSIKVSAKLTKQDPSKSLVPKSHCKNIRYRSSNTGVAAVDAKGKVTAKAKGTAYIYAISPNGVCDKAEIWVN